MGGHTDWVNGVVHLPRGRRIITCSTDGLLRLRDLESGTQIGEDWKNEEGEAGVRSMALSPNGKTVASGHNDGKVRLWDVKTRKVKNKWAGHTEVVGALCWSADGSRVASGSWDGTARIRDVRSGKTVLTIETEHRWVNAVIYSPDATKIATGGDGKDAVKIWNGKTGALFKTLKHDITVFSLAWTSDGKKLISGSFQIRIFNTATWEEIGVLDSGHRRLVQAISLSLNNRLLASAPLDRTARLWNLDTNLPIGPPLQHEDHLHCSSLSPDGKLLLTGCENKKVCAWDIHAVLKKAGLENQLLIGTNIEVSQCDSGTERTPRSSLSDNSCLEADATRCRDGFRGVDELSPRFFDGMEADDSLPMGNDHPHSSASTLLARLSSLLHRFRPNNADATELPQPSTPSGLHPLVMFSRLSSLIHRSPPENDASNELQPHSTPSRLLDLRALLAGLSSLWPHSRLNTDGEIQPHPTTHSGSRSDALIDRLSSLFRPQPHTNEEIQLSQYSRDPHVVEVAAMRDRQALYVAPRPRPHPHTQPNGTATHAQSQPIPWWAHVVLFFCCTSAQHTDGNAKPTQQHQQQCRPQGPAQPQASPSQTQSAAASTAISPIPSNTPNVQSRPLPLRIRFVLFLCCASPQHADGH
ncbi:WD40-repeat-containing domain protein [Suillus americanus]|nr:WD40-repeat-containing domain protein [Suillus americanus]